jgi:hypothetical protein
MKRMRFRHIELLLGAALLAAVFVPWVSLVAFYYPGAYLTFSWSPFDILWNALMSEFPGAPEVNAWLIGMTATNFVAVSALYVVATLGITGLTIPLIRSDIRRDDVSSHSWWLLACAAFIAFLLWVAWQPIPYLHE